MKKLFEIDSAVGQEKDEHKVLFVDFLDGEVKARCNRSDRIRRELGGNIVSKLGRGTFGYAFALDSGEVAKLTTDEEEARTSEHIIGINHPNIVNIYNVFEVHFNGISDKFWFIVEDKLKTNGDWDEYGRFVYHYRDWIIQSNNLEHVKNELFIRIGNRPGLKKYVHDIIEALKELRKHNIDWQDFHDKNIGVKNGNYVMFDFGISNSPHQEPPRKVNEMKLTKIYKKLLEAKKNYSSFNNWRDYNEQELNNEYKYEYVYHIEPHFGKLFKDYNDFKQEVEKTKPVKWTRDLDRITQNRSHVGTIEDLKDMTSQYQYPRDIDRIVKGIENNEPLPRPIILKYGPNKYWIMSGNSRSDAFEIYGITPEVIVLDVTNRKGKF